MLKAAQQKQHAAQADEAARTPASCTRRDPRPLSRRRSPDAPWLPEMGVLNEVIGSVMAAMPPARDIDGG